MHRKNTSNDDFSTPFFHNIISHQNGKTKRKLFQNNYLLYYFLQAVIVPWDYLALFSSSIYHGLFRFGEKNTTKIYDIIFPLISICFSFPKFCTCDCGSVGMTVVARWLDGVTWHTRIHLVTLAYDTNHTYPDYSWPCSKRQRPPLSPAFPNQQTVPAGWGSAPVGVAAFVCWTRRCTALTCAFSCRYYWSQCRLGCQAPGAGNMCQYYGGYRCVTLCNM